MSSNSNALSDIPSELIKKYAGSYPRYTSYPTALQLQNGYDCSEYENQCARSNQALIPRDLSIYVHLPFCHSLCYFCGCNKVVTQYDNPKVGKYLATLLKEIKLRAALFDNDRQVSQIHLGGGTPNFFTPQELEQILETISLAFNLKQASELEIGIEIDPRCIQSKQIYELASIGFNRFSIGIQDFSKEVQVAINRVQPERTTLEIINAAQQVSSSTSVDLITGLPKQSLNSFSTTLSKVIDTGVGRISAYNFAYLPTQIKAQRLIDGQQLPSLKQRLDIVHRTQETLINSGYTHIGVDHFAKPQDPLSIAYLNNTLQRNFQGYTTHKNTDLVGVGVSAISQFRNSFSQNSTSLSAYQASIEQGKIPVAKGLNLSKDDMIRAHIIQDIMCRSNIDLSIRIDHVCEGYGDQTLFNYFAALLPKLRQLEDENLITVHNQQLSFTSNGHFFRRQIASIFDRYHSPQTPSVRPHQPNVVRFSQAI